jgi:glyoxylase-like metal-dependent hydrolase (beta-lactamase superfamily II)
MKIAHRTTMFDLEHQGEPYLVAACLLESDGGVALIDPGPSAALGTFRRKIAEHGISVTDIRTILLTHIHLDHAGATGFLVQQNPNIQVYVHESAAPHLRDPGRLLKSARRVYGDQLEIQWGGITPVPAENLHALADGDHLHLGRREIVAAYTPGHAAHHVCYLDTDTGIAFVGDTAGIRVPGKPHVFPWAPPPEVQIQHWRSSIEKIQSWGPEMLFLTHFGTVECVSWHLADFDRRLQEWSSLVKNSLADSRSDSERAASFSQTVLKQIQQLLPYNDVTRLLKLCSLEACWYGLARYWRMSGTSPVER